MTIRRSGRRSGTLAVLSVAQFLIALDYSIIYIALGCRRHRGCSVRLG